jgi:hypothetical protein
MDLKFNIFLLNLVIQKIVKKNTINRDEVET